LVRTIGDNRKRVLTANGDNFVHEVQKAVRKEIKRCQLPKQPRLNIDGMGLGLKDRLKRNQFSTVHTVIARKYSDFIMILNFY
jgi:hypothetical protein